MLCELKYKKKKAREDKKLEKNKDKSKNNITDRRKLKEAEWEAPHQPSAAIAKNPFFRRFHEPRSVHGYPKKGRSALRS
jgi:hypothetical protein